MKIPVSIIIHCLNEEINISYSIESVYDLFSEIFIVDAGSTDKTLSILSNYPGLKIHQITGDRKTLVSQRNWALSNLPISNEWVYILDADEVVPLNLAEEIFKTVQNSPSNINGYWVNYHEYKFNKKLILSGLYPNYNMRLLRTGFALYENRTVNAHIKLTSGESGFLKNAFIHHDKRGIKSYIKRLSGITIIEAESINEIKNSKYYFKDLFFSHINRRMYLKKIFYKLPMRPLIVFFYFYIFRLGFLEGKAGFYNVLLRSIHELFVNMINYENRIIKRDS